MPIRINLLAEAQAIEEERRRDPVKRFIWAGVFLVVLVLVWSSSLQVKAMIGKSEVSNLQGQLNSRTNDYRQILDNQKKLTEIKQKLVALDQLATNRFLNGNLLNALQQTTVDNVQLLRLRVAQSYVLTEAAKSKTNGDRIIPGKPATSTEKILITLEAKDNSPNPGDAVNKFKQAIASAPYFEDRLGKDGEVKLASLGTPQTSPDGKRFVLFSIECRLPEKTR